MASLIGRVEDLIVENGEVKSEAKTNWMSWGKIGASNLSCSLIRLQRLVGRDLALVALCEFGEVAMIITLPGIDILVSNTVTR